MGIDEGELIYFEEGCYYQVERDRKDLNWWGGDKFWLMVNDNEGWFYEIVWGRWSGWMVLGLGMEGRYK